MEIEFLKDVSLKDFCTFHIGGRAKFLHVAHTTANLIEVCKYCKLHNIKYKVIGLGANILFNDNGFNGAIIVNKSNKITFKNNSVFAESGVNVTNLIMRCYLRSLCGFERLVGIPSTVGGAIFNNLGAFETSFGDFVEYVEVYDKTTNKIITLSNKVCKFTYRNSIFKKENYIILKVKLNLQQDEQLAIKQRINLTLERKKSTQPLNYPSAGSIFKHGNIIPAKTIDELGLKGTKIGDAEISTKHSGFIVNLGNATSKDVKQLITLIKEKVYTETGELLEPEIEFVD